MNVNADVSHQVLDRIKGSSERLMQAINQPGVDRCFKGGPMIQPQVPAQAGESAPSETLEVEPQPSVVDKAVDEVSVGVKAEAMESEGVDSAAFAESVSPLQSPYPAEQLEQEWKQMLQDVKQLQQESVNSRAVLDEVRVEMGKVAAYSRREVVRLGKRLDALERAEMDTGEVESSPPEPLNLSEDPYVKKQQQQIESLQEVVEGLNEQLQHFSSPEPLDLGKDAHILDQQQQLERLQQQLDRLQQISQPQEDEGSELTSERVEQLQQQVAETEQQLEQQSESTAAVGELTVQYGERIEQLAQSIQDIDQQLQQQTGVGKVADGPASNSLLTPDGRNKNIVEELRYEIGEVRKSSNRQLEALRSKLHAHSTPSEVNQIVKHATAQLQQRIDGVMKQVEQGQKRRPVETPTIRF